MSSPDRQSKYDFSYRPSVGMVILNSENKVFVAKRIDQHDSEAWQMPQGGIDRGEEPRDALFREMKEELGTDKMEILHESDDWFYYDFPNELASKLWGGRFRGQRQKWFVLRFVGNDSDIELDNEYEHKAEFSEWRWEEHHNVPKLIVPFKKKLYKALMEEFASFFK